MEFCRERKLLPQVALVVSSPSTFQVRASLMLAVKLRQGLRR